MRYQSHNVCIYMHTKSLIKIEWINKDFKNDDILIFISAQSLSFALYEWYIFFLLKVIELKLGRSERCCLETLKDKIFNVWYKKHLLHLFLFKGNLNILIIC